MEKEELKRRCIEAIERRKEEIIRLGESNVALQNHIHMVHPAPQKIFLFSSVELDVPFDSGAWL